MMTGAEQGVFSDGFMKKTGAFRLFWWISRRIVAQKKWSGSAAHQEDWYLVTVKTDDIGFVTVKSSYTPNGDAIKVIVLFALERKHQNHGHGTTVLRSFVEAQPEGTTVFVHCTKYARAMQRVLKNLRFVRNAKAGYPLEEYCLVKVPFGGQEVRPAVTLPQKMFSTLCMLPSTGARAAGEQLLN